MIAALLQFADRDRGLQFSLTDRPTGRQPAELLMLEFIAVHMHCTLRQRGSGRDQPSEALYDQPLIFIFS